MDRCTVRHDITEILLKAALNTLQSIIQQSARIAHAYLKQNVFCVSWTIVYFFSQFVVKTESRMRGW